MKKAIGLTLLLLVMFVFCLHNFVDTHSNLSLLASISTGLSFVWVMFEWLRYWKPR